MTEVYIGIGSNLGNRQSNIALAISGMANGGLIEVSSVSDMVQTAPYGDVLQDDFLNCCVRGQTNLRPLALLQKIKALEVELGRVASVRWGPRLIDIDILLYGAEVIDLPSLTIPHADMFNRNFVVFPLLQVITDDTGVRRALLAACASLEVPQQFQTGPSHRQRDVDEVLREFDGLQAIAPASTT